MKTINAYLTFNGNCREAMAFYQKCLGGKLLFQTVGESPLSEKMPVKMRNCILHSSLTNDGLELMASDLAGDNGLLKGNTVSLVLNCSSEKEVRQCYKKLSAGGLATHPLEDTFWGTLFGNLIDKFGNHWILNFNKKSNN